jgi:hypothetical protein
MTAVDRFATADTGDLVGTCDLLIGDESCDPFDDSAEAVDAWDDADWTRLLLDNLADLQRTRELALLAEQYVSSTDFSMKNLAPPGE